jgi:hypothetical protein
VVYVISNEPDSVPDGREDMRLGDFGFPQPTLILLLPGREVHCGIGDIPRTISIVSNSSPNVVREGAAAT